MLSSKYYTAHLESCNKLCIYHAEQKDIELDKPNWPLDITNIYIENSFIDHCQNVYLFLDHTNPFQLLVNELHYLT